VDVGGFCDRCNEQLDEGAFSGDFALTEDRSLCLDCRLTWLLLALTGEPISFLHWVDKGLVRWSRAKVRDLI
jgi:hypothetical protein